MPPAIKARLNAAPLSDSLAAMILVRIYRLPRQAISIEQLQLELSLHYPLAILAPERTDSAVHALVERRLVLLLVPADSGPGLAVATAARPANDALYLSAIPT